MEYNKSFLDIYRKYIRKGWYENVISSVTLDRWCENFNCDTNEMKFDPKICAHFLLNSLIFYQNRQLEAIIVNIQNRIKSELNQKNEQRYGRRLSEDELSKIWTEYKKDCYIISAAYPEDTAGSAHHATRLWRNISGIETGSINNLMNAILNFIIIVESFF